MDPSESNQGRLGRKTQLQIDSETESQASSQGKRRKTSGCWTHFRIVVGDDGIKRDICKHCGKVYLHGNGTKNLWRHLDVWPEMPRSIDNDRGTCIHCGAKLNDEANARDESLDHDKVRELICMCIIEHNLPYSFVEYRRVRELLKYLNPAVELISRKTAAVDVYKFYLKGKESLRCALERIPSRICLTSDVWTASTVNEGYISLTAHYIDENWKLNSKILAFRAMPPPRTGNELAKKLLFCLQEWKIEKKLFSFTLDNATNNDSMQRTVKDQLCLQNDLLCDGKFFHVRCSAHILNLIVQEGLKVIGSAVYKIRESIKYVKGSQSRMDMFKECVENVGLEFTFSLSLDLPTRWNFTYKMLKSAIKYHLAFSSLQLLDTSYWYCPSQEDWERGKNMCEFLMPFDEITTLFSGSTYPTSNLYFMQVWKIECWLKENVESPDEIIREMAVSMQGKFTKYWKEYSVILAMGAVFDPRMKFKLLDFCYNKLDKTTCKEKLDYMRSQLYELFESYKNKGKFSMTTSSVSAASTSSHGSVSEGTSLGGYDEYMNCAGDIGRNVKSYLDVYLEESELDMNQFVDMDILVY